ncbi:MAG: DUF6273 domain-containing protein [Clostridia bacterium]
MIITNEPMLLDSTGQQILDRFDRQNALLAMMAEGSRSAIYSDMKQVANIVRGNSVENNQRIFPIGDQFIIPWRDMDDPNHNTAGTAYQVPMDIVHHGPVVLQSGEIVPGMFLQWHYCSPYGVQFSHMQAFMNCANGLAAGTYYITFGGSWGSKGATAGTQWKFTLTKAVPAGGRLSGFESMPDVLPSTWKVMSWDTPTSVAPAETVNVTPYDSSVDTATSLGTMNLTTISADGLNCMMNVGYGNNRIKTSAIRQYLNKSGSDWFATQGDFDIRPNEYAKKGFMTGFDEDFLSAIKPVKVTTALNTVEGFTDATEDVFDTFFLPSLEQMNGVPQLATVEGPHFEYWRRRLGLNGFASYHPTLYDGYKIPAINAQTSPQDIRLRSIDRGNCGHVLTIYSSGFIGSYFTSLARRFSPVGVVC